MEQKHEWKRIWEARTPSEEILCCGDPEQVLLELKRLAGFDVVGDGLRYGAFSEQCNEIMDHLSRRLPKGIRLQSVFEVGCGSGANLFLMERAGLVCGGIDYSQKLISCAKQVLHSKDILCAEAAELLEEPQYDALISNSVFGYFRDHTYAETVLEKMARKARYVMGITEVFDVQKQEDFIACRKAMIPDYEERYRNLPRLFYSRDFFAAFAERHAMDISFEDSHLEGYWNNEFMFHCYLYKR